MTTAETSEYVPRKCSATGRLITAKDHASTQFSVGYVNEQGIYTGESFRVCLSGYVRNMSESDDSLNRLATEHGLLKNVWSAQK